LEFFYLLSVVASDGFEVESIEAMRGVLLGFEEEDFVLANLSDEVASVVGRGSLIEAVAVGTLGVAVELGKACGHVLAVDVVAAVGFLDGKNTATRDAPELSALEELAVACADVERESRVGLA
jgi:hypothetical protein